MTWKEDIPASGNGKKAEYSAHLCSSESELDALFHLSNDPGGFDFYRSQIPTSVIWPMAVLLDVDVPHQFRRQGFGTAAVHRFVLAAREKAARLGFLRVGWVGDISERDWRVAWYQRLGWHLLQNPTDYLIVPFMYREL